jgi:hypothetical protein
VPDGAARGRWVPPHHDHRISERRRGAGLTADGDPDPSFGDGGVSVVDIGAGAVAFDVIELPDGRIVAAGKTNEPGTDRNLLLVGLTSGGDLDPTFGIDGVLVLDRYGDDQVDRLFLDGDRLFLRYETSLRGAGLCCSHHNAIAEVLPRESDAWPPYVVWRVPRQCCAGPYDSDRLDRLRGIVNEPNSGIRGPVTVAVRRTMTDGSCKWMGADGRFRAAACDAMTWLPATGTFRFERGLPRPLRPSVGTDVRAYRAYAAVTDGAGNAANFDDPVLGNYVQFDVTR